MSKNRKQSKRIVIKPKEHHRAKAKGALKKWESAGETWAEEIAKEFDVDECGNITLSAEEFKDLISYTADEYYG